MELTEKTIKSDTVYQGKKVSLSLDTICCPNGDIVTKEKIHRAQGAAILPFFDEKTVLLERQFRHPFEAEILAVPAGKADQGEDLSLTAKRELEEETGYVASQLVDVGRLYPAPAYSDEVVGLFLGLDIHPGTRNLDKDEFINLVRVSLKDFLAMCEDGRIKDARSIALAFRYLSWKRHKKD
jgi:ADP-ribose pyrophosphatase